MAVSISVIYRKDKMNEQGLAPIYIRLTKNRRTSYIATDLRIEERYWDPKNKKLRPGYPNNNEANTYLNGLVYQLQGESLREQTENRAGSVRTLKEKITGDKSISFFEVAQGLLDRYKSNRKIGTHDKCRSIVNKIREFARTDKLTLQEIDNKFLARFERHLRDDLGNKTNTVHKDMKFIRRVFNAAYRQGLVEHNQSPFLRYEIKVEKTVRDHLREDELNLLETLVLVPGSRLDLHRDMFVFASYTGGLRVSDVLLLRWSCFDGTHLRLTIRKTSAQHTLKVPNASLAIIKKYMPDEGNQGDEFIFPMLPAALDLEDYIEVDRKITSSTAYMNKNLKVLAKRAGIKKNLHFHCSRHTWACLALKKGMGIEHVSKLMAHSSIRETQVYAKLVSNELDAAMDRFNI